MLISSWWIPASGTGVDVFQDTSSRSYDQEPLGDSLWSITREDGLVDPTRVQEYGDDIFVLDEATSKLKRFARDGSFLNEIGAGRGFGAGELYQPVAFDVDADYVWVLDEHDTRIQGFTRSGLFRHTFHTDIDVRAFQVLEEGLVVFSPYSEPLFTRLNMQGEVRHTFGEEIAQRTQNPVVRDGTLLARDGYLLFAPYYAGRLFMYDERGMLTRRIHTIDGFDFLGAAGTEAQYRRPGWEVRTRDVSQQDDILYVHGWHRDDDQVHSVVDRYSWPDGAYLDSFRLPSQAQSFFASKSTYLLAYRDQASVVAYDRQ